MKKHTLFWLALSWLMVACSSYQGPTPDYDPSYCQWRITSEQAVLVNVAEEKGNIWHIVLPNYPKLVSTPRRDVIHISIRVKDDKGGWALDEIKLPPIPRSGHWPGIQEVKINDRFVYDAPLLYGYIDNAFGQDIINVKFKGKTIALRAGAFSQQDLSPGPLTIYWQIRPNGRVYEYETAIANDNHKMEFNGEMVDWVITLERR